MSLLPSSASASERALEAVCAVPLNNGLRDLWNEDNCPEALLPYLAWAFSVDQWDNDWDESVKRDVVRNAKRVHKQKGTVGSMRRALISMGLGDAVITAVQPYINHDGTSNYDGSEQYHDGTLWAQYQVSLTQAIPTSQARFVRETLESSAPARCELVSIIYPSLLYDGSITFNAEYNYGGA